MQPFGQFALYVRVEYCTLVIVEILRKNHYLLLAWSTNGKGLDNLLALYVINSTLFDKMEETKIRLVWWNKETVFKSKSDNNYRPLSTWGNNCCLRESVHRRTIKSPTILNLLDECTVQYWVYCRFVHQLIEKLMKRNNISLTSIDSKDMALVLTKWLWYHALFSETWEILKVLTIELFTQ